MSWCLAASGGRKISDCLLGVLPVSGACHLLSTTLSEQLRVVLDPRGYMEILNPTDRDVGELTNWGEALADFWGKGKVGSLKPGSPP